MARDAVGQTRQDQAGVCSWMREPKEMLTRSSESVASSALARHRGPSLSPLTPAADANQISRGRLRRDNIAERAKRCWPFRGFKLR